MADDMDVEQPRLATELFAGADDLSEEQRTILMRNMERMLARSTLSATAMTLDADVVIIAAAEDGGEVHVRASGDVLARVSSGFRGWLQECRERTIRLANAAGRLHPEAAVRFVLIVAHAVAAHADTEPVDGLSIPDSEAPPLHILLHACQIADCWDVLTVPPAAARCVAHAAKEAMAADKRAATATLLQLLRLATDAAEEALRNLREPVEAAIAEHVPLQWLPYALRRLDLEGACRVINRIGDSDVVLPPLVLKGATALEPPWHAHESPSVQGATTARSTKPRPSKRVEVRPSATQAFHLEIRAKEPDEERKSKQQAAIAAMQAAIDSAIGNPNEDVQGAIASAIADIKEQVGGSRVMAYVHNEGATVLLARGSVIKMTPDGRSKMPEGVTQRAAPIEKVLGPDDDETPRLIAAGQSLGYDNVCAAMSLGGCKVEATIRVSRLQNQFEVLARWQGCRGRARLGGTQSPIVGCLKRLQHDAGAVSPRVKLIFRAKRSWAFDAAADTYYACIDKLLTPLVIETATATASPAATTLCESMTEYMALRLDDYNGPVNRSTCVLDERTMLALLQRPQFDSVFGPSSEKALLRMAVDWAWQPGRTPRAINAITKQIYWAGVPTVTLMHMDEGSGWDYISVPHTHTLRDRLHDLASHHWSDLGSDLGHVDEDARLRHDVTVRVSSFIEAALDAQRAGTHLEDDSELLRPCFRGEEAGRPQFPSGQKLHAIARNVARDRQTYKTRAEQLQVQVRTLKATIVELEAEVAATHLADPAPDIMDTQYVGSGGDATHADAAMESEGGASDAPRKPARAGEDAAPAVLE